MQKNLLRRTGANILYAYNHNIVHTCDIMMTLALLIIRREKLKRKALKRKRLKLRDPEAELSLIELKEFNSPFIVQGYVNKPKGSRVHTWLRGHWRQGLTHEQCCLILNAQPDFLLEKSRLEKWWLCKGHGSTKTTVSTPESVEIEYDWGKGKFEFRNHINTKSTKLEVFRAGVLRSLGRHSYVSRIGQPRPPPLPRRRHWRFIRRANDYLRAYSLFQSPRDMQVKADKDNVSLFSLIEKSRRIVKSHRCVGEQEFKFTASDDPNDQVSPEDDVLCSTYLVRDRAIVDICERVDQYLYSLTLL